MGQSFWVNVKYKVIRQKKIIWINKKNVEPQDKKKQAYVK